jgi:tRNA threonylcarbamoyladenosine biosynthesis protein TsaB
LRVLAIDTALGACSACIVQAGETVPLAADTIPMERGHAEALMPLLDRLSAQVDGGISAARGIGLAAGIPVVGVATLSAFLAPLMVGDRRGLYTAAIDAKHGHLYIQAVAPGGRSIIPPGLMTYRDAIRLLGSGPIIVAGSAAAMLAAEARAQGVEAQISDVSAFPDIAWVARLGALADPAQALPKPLYLRDPDAKPQDGARIARQ